MVSLLGKQFKRVREGLSWRIRGLLGDELIGRIIVRTARVWRPFLNGPVFIGITGSAGKTTTKELLLGILSHKKRGVGSPKNDNGLWDVGKTILRMTPKHSFCVSELTESWPGDMDKMVSLLKPSIGIVTVAGYDHLARYDSADDIDAEMSKLISTLPSSGIAVINADDARVFPMATNCAARVITYGTSAAAELRAENIDSSWPDRLEFEVTHGGQRAKVRTLLCGTHFVPSVLAAIGGGLAAGLKLTECAEAIAGVTPLDGRMQPVTTSDGVTFIRDDFKAPMWSLDATLEFMRSARAKRKIIVIGELSDVSSQKGSNKGAKYAKTANVAQEIADIVIFVGPWSSSALKARRPGSENALRVFTHVRDAAEYVNSITREGDLVLLKGTNKQNHLLRIILARSGEIACWRDDCKREFFCNECRFKAEPSGFPSSFPMQSGKEREASIAIHTANSLTSNERIVVGLGNPDSGYSGTPHNIGHEVVDHLASSLGLTWEEVPEASIARGSKDGRKVSLIKIRRGMNHIGEGLKRLSESMQFNPDQCILVFDDLDLPLGAVRPRMKGGAGGHRGVASILEAFQTDAFRRVKIGIGKDQARVNQVEYVLTPFDPEDRAIIDKAILDAGVRVLELTKN